jgi:prepilin-type processing-associated H-X9-DG protein
MKDNRNYFWTKRTESQGAIVFTGDSLIGNWGNLSKAFPTIHVANRGIGGDVTRGLLFRFQEDVLDLHPKAIVILIGSNDLSAKAEVSGIVSNISAILDEAAKEAPIAPIVLCQILPRDSPQAPIDADQVTKLNAALTELVKGRANVTFFDSHALFALPDGAPDPQYFKSDKLHLGDAGYARFAQALDKVFADLKLKP